VDGAEPQVLSNPAIAYSVGNLLENAVEFAASRVDVTMQWSAENVVLEVADDGPGFSVDILDRLGDPYVTSRGLSRGRGRGAVRASAASLAQGGGAKPDPEGTGLGLGFFIAKTILERAGAHLQITNKARPHTGAIVRIIWTRRAFAAALEPQDHQSINSYST